MRFLWWWTDRPAAQTCPAPRRPRRGNELPGRPLPVSPLSRLGCYSDTTASCPQRRGNPVALGPTRSQVTRTDARATRTTRRERKGRRLQREQPPPKPKRLRPTGTYHHPPCRRREGVDWGRGRALRRRRDAPSAAPICNKVVVPSRPTATRSGARART